MLELLFRNLFTLLIFSRFWISAKVRMAFNAKPVEGAAHIHLPFGGHVEESEIDG